MTDLEALRAIIDHQLRNLLRFPHFPGEVVVQHEDLTVDVRPDSPYLPGLSALQLRVFVPGAVVKVAAGTRVAVVFEDGDRMRPVAIPVFDQDAGELLELHVGDANTDIVLSAGTHGVAREGDSWDIALNGLTAGPYPVTGTFTIKVGSTKVKAG